jgi:hypothetical protein
MNKKINHFTKNSKTFQFLSYIGLLCLSIYITYLFFKHSYHLSLSPGISRSGLYLEEWTALIFTGYSVTCIFIFYFLYAKKYHVSLNLFFIHLLGSFALQISIYPYYLYPLELPKRYYTFDSFAAFTEKEIIFWIFDKSELYHLAVLIGLLLLQLLFIPIWKNRYKEIKTTPNTV